MRPRDVRSPSLEHRRRFRLTLLLAVAAGALGVASLPGCGEGGPDDPLPVSGPELDFGRPGPDDAPGGKADGFAWPPNAFSYEYACSDGKGGISPACSLANWTDAGDLWQALWQAAGKKEEASREEYPTRFTYTGRVGEQIEADGTSVVIHFKDGSVVDWWLDVNGSPIFVTLRLRDPFGGQIYTSAQTFRHDGEDAYGAMPRFVIMPPDGGEAHHIMTPFAFGSLHDASMVPMPRPPSTDCNFFCRLTRSPLARFFKGVWDTAYATVADAINFMDTYLPEGWYLGLYLQPPERNFFQDLCSSKDGCAGGLVAILKGALEGVGACFTSVRPHLKAEERGHEVALCADLAISVALGGWKLAGRGTATASMRRTIVSEVRALGRAGMRGELSHAARDAARRAFRATSRAVDTKWQRAREVFSIDNLEVHSTSWRKAFTRTLHDFVEAEAEAAVGATTGLYPNVTLVCFVQWQSGKTVCMDALDGEFVDAYRLTPESLALLRQGVLFP